MPVLVLADHDNTHLKPSTFNTLSAALKIDTDVSLLVAGSHLSALVETARSLAGVKTIYVLDHADLQSQLAEHIAPSLLPVLDKFTHIFAPATTSGKNLLPRLAALKDAQAISEIVDIISANQFKRPVYAGNAIATIESSDKQIFATIRSTAFDAVSATGGNAETEIVSYVSSHLSAKFVSQELTKSERPELTAASIVVSGGRALGSAENFKLVEALADKMKAAIGASRAAVDSGYAPNDYQVGQTGKIVAPDLYVAVGISGAIQHLAGMKDSKIIVAINKDAEAPIFQVADYGLVADLFTAVPELTEKL
jgi:electron transfer flavoprotein alpha subunit